MKTIGVVLVIPGSFALVYGGIEYNRNSTSLEIGSMEVAATKQGGVPILAIVGTVVLLGGIALVVNGNRDPLRP